MSDTATRITNSLAERYVLERELGQGGMATVFLAQDVKHDRKVAFKVLRPELAAVIGAERFLQEIKVTANLQHPHILPLHDSGNADGFLFYVMPYVEGESLRDLLDREKQLAVEDAIDIAKAVASALDYAHRQGVIHRDIKPENILMHDGQATVADFGIALAVSQASGARLTETGLSIGTPHYMSPEQAMGDRELDARADVYSLGAILYEMLTGDPPYTGSTAQAIVAKVITEKAPPVTAIRDTVPINVSVAVGKALAKMPADRFRSASDFAEALSNPGFAVATAATAAAVEALPPAQVPAWKRFAWPAATAVFAALAIGALMRPTSDQAAGAPSRFSVPVAEIPIGNDGGRLIAVSPVGSEIVYVGSVDGQQQLVLRRSAELELRPIPDTEGGRDPTFSPDGEWVGFTQGNDIKRVRTTGGASLTVARDAVPAQLGLHWGESDDIVFVIGPRSLGIVPGSGGEVRVVESSDSIEGGGFRWPHLMPDGQSILVTTFSSLETAQLALVDVESGTADVVVDEGVFPQFVQSGHIVYGHGSGTIFAVPFDAAGRRVTGQPTALLEGVQVFNGGATQFAPSSSGSVAYLEGEVGREVPVTIDTSGVTRPISLPPGVFGSPRFSPDGGRIALQTSDEESGVRIYDQGSGTLTLLSTEPGESQYPVWGRAGEWVVYGHRFGAEVGADVVRRRADGSGEPEVLYSAPGDQWPQAVTRDGAVLIRENATETGRDLLLVPPGSDSAIVLLNNPWHEWMPKISPNEHWMVYVSNESGRPEVYITAFPVPAGKVQISRNGGEGPVWSVDGQGLYYLTPEDEFVAVRLRTEGTIAVMTREVLFDARGWQTFFLNAEYDVHPDGGRFVFIAATESEREPGITVVVNWFEELKELMGN